MSKFSSRANPRYRGKGYCLDTYLYNDAGAWVRVVAPHRGPVWSPLQHHVVPIVRSKGEFYGLLNSGRSLQRRFIVLIVF